MPVLIAAVFVPRRLEWLSIDLRVGAAEDRATPDPLPVSGQRPCAYIKPKGKRRLGGSTHDVSLMVAGEQSSLAVGCSIAAFVNPTRIKEEQ